MKSLYTKPVTEVLARVIESPFCAGSIMTVRQSNLGSGSDGFSGYAQPGQTIGEDNGSQDSRAKGNNLWSDDEE